MSKEFSQGGWCNITLVKFLAVGVLNTIFGYSIYLAGLWLGLHYSAAIATATLLGTLFNFKSIGFLVFQSKDNSRIYRFLCVYIAIYFLNVLGVGLLLLLDIEEWLGGLILILPLALFSFYLNSRFVFRP
ncbi:MAG: polysaccharide biosynthesis protein GtrA [Pusillimonas sp.]|nr:polysaccharide biosynthesis protein GtrA [Pusillimonas sp.]MBC43475.1 polysaccharide biosynthesis protein GtrA [Pusillimonas sp.]HCP78489.1 polysaccharide biosynthesis protein GtrA [Pusillimonas sp.]|tara:strand:+ start:230 stop:619 length:390 start_codon:yes stop_codon:yes gene_type:complete